MRLRLFIHNNNLVMGYSRESGTVILVMAYSGDSGTVILGSAADEGGNG